MEEQKLQELSREAGANLTTALMGEHAHQRAVKAMQEAIAVQVEQMTQDGRAFRLTEEEERLLKSFRRFKFSCRDGQVFKWQTRRGEPYVELISPDEASLIRDPQEVS